MSISVTVLKIHSNLYKNHCTKNVNEKKSLIENFIFCAVNFIHNVYTAEEAATRDVLPKKVFLKI